MKFWYQSTIKSKRFLNENAVISGASGEIATPLVQPDKPFIVVMKYDVSKNLQSKLKKSQKG